MIEVVLRQPFPGIDVCLDFQTDITMLALFGPSGAGKTTVLNAIAGLLRPAMGRIVVNGRILFDSQKDINIPSWQRHIGYVFQDQRLFPHLNVRHNLLYGVKRNRLRKSIVQFGSIVDLLDLGPLLKRRTYALSGGEARRVAIGRALLSQPDVLLLDEPLVGLHHEARDQVMCYLQGMRREFRLPTVLVSHAPEEVIALTDQVLVMQAGRMHAQYSTPEFKTQMLLGPIISN